MCQTYLYQDGAYAAKGKLGVAVTRLKTVIIYGQKQRVISNLQLAATSSFTVTADKFLTFYDDTRQCWGVTFPSEADLESFLQKVTFVKFELSGGLVKQQTNCAGAGKVVEQGAGKVVEQGDSVVVEYHGYLLGEDKLGAQIDSNESYTVNVRADAGIIKGWLESLPGCVESGAYVVAIPADLAYGDRGIPNRVPPNSDLVFMITVKQILPASKSPNSASQSADLTDTSSVDSFPTTRPNQNTSSVDSFPSAHPSQNGVSDKSEILSRMARMGAHQALPTHGNILSSPDQEDARSERSSSIKSNRSKRKMRTSSSVTQPEDPPKIPMKPGPLVAQSHFAQAAPSSYPAFANYPAYPPQLLATPEVKETLDISKGLGKSVANMEESLREVQNKLHVISEQAMLYNRSVSGCPTPDTQLLMYQLQRIISENETVRGDVKEKTRLLEEKSGKITELLNKNRELVNAKNEALEMTQNSFLANSSSASKQIQELEQGSEQLKNELKVLRNSDNSRQFEIDAKQDQINSLRSQIESLYRDNNKLQSTLFEAKSELSSLRLSSSDNTGQEEILQREIAKLKERLQTSLVEKLDISQQLDDQVFSERSVTMRFEKRVKQLQCLLEEQASDTGMERLTRENRELGEEVQKLQARCEAVKKEKVVSESKLGEELETLRNSQHGFQATVSSQEEEIADFQKIRRELEEKLVFCKSEAASQVTDLKSQVCRLQSQIAEQESCNQQPSSSSSPSTADTKELVTSKVKLILNTVFREFREKIVPSEVYSGREVLGVTMDILKHATLSLLQDDKGESASESSSESESDDDDEGAAGASGERDEVEHDDVDEGAAVSEEEEDIAGTVNSQEFHIPGQLGSDLLQSAGLSTSASSTTETEERLPRSPDRESRDSLSPAPESPSSSGSPSPSPEPSSLLEEFAARSEEELWLAPSEPPPSPAPPSFEPSSPAPPTFEPNLQHTTVSVEDIAHLSPEVSYFIRGGSTS